MTLSDHVATRMIDALQHLEADGCRRVHIIAHSMGARVMSGAADRLSHFFPRLPATSQGMPVQLPLPSVDCYAVSKGVESSERHDSETAHGNYAYVAALSTCLCASPAHFALKPVPLMLPTGLNSACQETSDCVAYCTV